MQHIGMAHHSHDLIPADLLLLQKHVKLGKKHLENCLSPQEIDAIFEFVNLPAKTKRELSASFPELAGQVSLVFNTILTATLGFWMGLRRLLKLDMGSKATLMSVLALSLIVGGFIGFQSILFRRKIARDILDKRKLKELELEIVKRINEDREKEVKKKIGELVSLLKRLKIEVNRKDLENPLLEFPKLCLQWLPQVQKNDLIRRQLKEKIRSKARYAKGAEEFKIISQKLSECSIHSEISVSSWIRANLTRLVIELIPALFGGAASLFVYIGGARTRTEEMGDLTWISFLDDPKVKTIQLIIMGIIVIYFAFSVFYMNCKAFKRDKEIERVEAKLIEEEKRLDLLNDHLLKIKEGLRILTP